MAEKADRDRWRAMDRRAERDGFAAWQREALSGEDLPFQEAFRAEAQRGGDVLRAFMLFCLPPKSFGHQRRFRSGYLRLVAVVWRIAPDLLEGCRTHEDVALALGISRRAWMKHVAKVDALMGCSEHQAQPTSCAPCKNCKKPESKGSFPRGVAS